jgi:hypothetical protein
MRVLMDLRLADQRASRPLSAPESADLARLSQEGVQQLCAREDAAAWIIAPLEQGKELPAGVEMKLWRLLGPQFQLAKGDGAYIWRRIDAFWRDSMRWAGAGRIENAQTKMTPPPRKA